MKEMNKEINIVLTGNPPRTTHQQKKVTVKHGRPLFYEPPKLKQARSLLTYQLYKYRPPQPIKGAVSMTVRWFYQTKESIKHNRPKTTRPDLDNMAKLLKDCMTDCNYWLDDAQVTREQHEKYWSYKPRIEINIKNISE